MVVSGAAIVIQIAAQLTLSALEMFVLTVAMVSVTRIVHVPLEQTTSIAFPTQMALGQVGATARVNVGIHFGIWLEPLDVGSVKLIGHVRITPGYAWLS